MAGGTVTATWTGSYSRTPTAYVAGPPSLAPLAISVANTAGQWLFAVVSWRQDAGTAGVLQYPSSVNVSDDAGNFWIPLQPGRHDTGIVRCAIWMAPAARAARYVFVAPESTVAGDAYQSALDVLIMEVTADCPWYQVGETDFGYANQGTSLSVSQTNTTTGLFTAGVLAWDNVSATVSITSTGWNVITGGQAGAFLDAGAMGVANFSAALTQWTGDGLPSPPAARYYEAASTFTYDTNMQQMVADGIKICLDLRPAYSPVSSGDLASLTTLLQTLKTAGAVVDVCLWHEPYYEGLTIAQYNAMIQYYGPTVRQYYPLVFVTSVQSVQNNNENAWYPGDAWVDKCATDFYCYDYAVSGYTLAQAVLPANTASPPKPFGIWECNSSTDPVAGQTQVQADSYFAYIQSYMTGRAGSGLPNADVLFFNSGEHNLLTGQNAGFEGGTGSWTATACTLTDTAAQAHTGTDSASLSASSTSNMNIGYTAGGTAAIPVTAGVSYTMSAWFRAATVLRSCQVGVNWYTSGGGFISSSFPTSGNDSTSAWTQLSITAVAPGTAAFAQPVCQVQAPGGSGEVHYVDDVLFATQSNDATIIGTNFGSAVTSDYRIALWQSAYAALRTLQSANGTDHSGDLAEAAFYATTAGSPLTLSASSATTMDWAGVLVSVQGVTNAIPFPYTVPDVENWPVLITEIAAGPVINADPVLLQGTAHWTAQNGTVAAVTWPAYQPWPDYQSLITPSLSLTPSGSAAFAAILSEEEPVSPAVRYTALAYVYSVAGYPGGYAQAAINWYTSGASYISTSSGPEVTLLPGAWTQLTFANGVFPPANAAYGQAGVQIAANSGNVPSSAVLYIGYAALGVGDAYENTPVDDLAWTDISTRNFTQDSIKISRGIQYENQSLEAGTMTVNLASNDGAMMFGNILSSYWPNIGDTDVPIRLRAVWQQSVTPYYVLFSGFTDEIAFGWAEDDGTWYGYAAVEASDAWSRLTSQMLGAGEQEVLEDSPVVYCTCNLSGANLAAGNTTPVVVLTSQVGAGAATSSFTGSSISLTGNAGLSCWQSASTPGGADQGVALGYFPLGGLPPVSAGMTAEFWMSPVVGSVNQPAPATLTVCTCWARNGPMWSITINNNSGASSSTASVTTYDKSTGAAATMSIGSTEYLTNANAVLPWFFAVSFTQTTLTVVVNPGSSTQNSVTVSCNLAATAIGLSLGGNAGPVYGYNTGGVLGFMNIAIASVAVFAAVIPAARITAHYATAYTAWPSELDTSRLARIAGYAGATPVVLAMRCLDLPLPPAADVDPVTAITDTNGQVTSDYFTNIASSALAAMLVPGTGALVYRRRLEWYDRPAPQWVLGESVPLALNSNLLNGFTTAGWTAGNGATLTGGSVANGGNAGPWFQACGVFHGNGATAGPYIVTGSLSTTPVTPGLWYAAQALVYCPAGYASGVSLELAYYTSGGSLLTDSVTPAVALPAASIAYFPVAAFQAPATAAYATVTVAAAGTPSSPVLFYVTDAYAAQVGAVTAGGAGATAPEVPYLPTAKLSSDRALLFNQAVLTQYGTSTVTTYSQTDLVFAPTSGILVTIANAASVTARAGIPYTATIYVNNTAQALPYVLSEGSMEDFGYWITQTLAAPLLRPETVTLTPAATPQAMLAGLGIEVGDTVTFRRRPQTGGAPEIQVLTYASKLTHTINVEKGRWTAEYELSPFQQGQVLACDDVIHGVLTGGNLLPW